MGYAWVTVCFVYSLVWLHPHPLFNISPMLLVRVHLTSQTKEPVADRTREQEPKMAWTVEPSTSLHEHPYTQLLQSL